MEAILDKNEVFPFENRPPMFMTESLRVHH